MTAVFVDTAFYIALTNPRDTWHEGAKSIALETYGEMETTEFVLVELANHLGSPATRTFFIRSYEALRMDEKTIIEPASSEAIRNGLSIYAERSDKGWSLTDCISIAVMGRRGLTDVLTTDHPFEQAGFRILLKS